MFWPAGMSLTPDLSDAASIPEDVVVRRMVALFDYDPWESSPNVDSEVSTMRMHEPHCVFYLFFCLFVCFMWFVMMFQNIIVFSLFLSAKGWTRLSFRRHHIRVRWNGSRWILLCECQRSDCSLVFKLTVLCTSLIFISISGGFAWTERVGSIKLSAATSLGLEEKRHARMLASDANSQTQWDISSFYNKRRKMERKYIFF